VLRVLGAVVAEEKWLVRHGEHRLADSESSVSGDPMTGAVVINIAIVLVALA